MRHRIAVVTALLGALVAPACSTEADGSASVDGTTAELLTQPVGDGVSTPVAVDPSLVDDGAPRVQVDELGFDRGDREAIVKVVELSDFGCGFCKRFHDETFPMIRDEFIETGKVEWKFIPYITGMFENSLAATEAGECVMEQDDRAYEEIALRLWTDQGDWKGSDDAGALIRGWVTGLDVDMAAFDACLAEDRRLSRIASATTLARQVGVRGTPTFVVIGYPPLQGALPTELFQQILTAVHDEESRRRAGGAGADAEPGNG
jgi:protein-disulfide isomerase